MRLILGGREIIHARCHACNANLLAEVLEFEQQIIRSKSERKRQNTLTMDLSAEEAELLAKS
ncbi:MAG: hypothetical protein H0U74_16085 [Bradymonadaceae bacterium]|nr:hypothetical protein [Lujinxingiaceae bacterium]